VTVFSVWAPRAERVEVVLGGRRVDLVPSASGWHSADVEAPEDADYEFALDGGSPLPDPRSPWQPFGVHGPSRRFDPARFAWTDTRFRPIPLEEAIIYELHVGTFTDDGTFRSTIDRLDRLVELGVTHVELMPIAAFAGRHGWGYDGVDLFAPHDAYGTPEDLQALVDACHARALAVIFDVVYNHLGPEGNYLGQFGPYFTDRYLTPWGSAVNVDGPGSDEVRRFFIDNALQWLRDFHADGLRLDAVHAIVDTSAQHLLEQLASEVEQLAEQTGRHFDLIAEDDRNDPRPVRPRSLGGYGLDAQWSDDFHHALHGALTGEQFGYYADFGSLTDIAEALSGGYVYRGRYSPFRQRTHGRAPIGLPGRAFVGYLQNHDQIGNRARGERATHLMTPGRLRVGATLVLTAPFVPLLFQGEEWAASTPFPYFADHGDPDLVAAVRAGRLAELAPFGWSSHDVLDPEAETTFRSAKLDWQERDEGDHRAMFEWYRTLIALRREIRDLGEGQLEDVHVEVDEKQGSLVMRRGSHVVACNVGERVLELTIPVAEVVARSDPRIELVPGDGSAPGASNGCRLPRDTAAIVRLAR
jgi:maltooligosyltrehalose trehalohydrolase